MNENTHQLAQDLARFMGWDYLPGQDGWSAKIINPPTQAELWIHLEHGRVVISGGFGELHEYAPYEARSKHRITCAATKTISQIASDVARRIFPDYLRDLQIAKQGYAEHVERMKGLAIATMKFAAILNMPPPELDEKEEVRFHMGFCGTLWGDVQIDTRSVDIKLTDVPFDVAAMMLVPLGEYIRLHPKEETEE